MEVISKYKLDGIPIMTDEEEFVNGGFSIYDIEKYFQKQNAENESMKIRTGRGIVIAVN